MDSRGLALLTSLLIAGALTLVGAYFIQRYYRRKARTDLKRTMHSLVLASSPGAITRTMERPADYNAEEVAQGLTAKRGKKTTDTLEGRLYRAGYFSSTAPKTFVKWLLGMTILLGGCSLLLVVFVFPLMSASMKGCLIIMGLFSGYAGPYSYLERRIRSRGDEISYHLPMSIEQIAIGVSSGLDVWPCIMNLLSLAEQRDAFNPVLELLKSVERYVRSGTSIEESFRMVGERSGHVSLKHAFTFLAQVVEHGGDITKNLQDMADATMIQRATEVEGRIAALPVKATGPLCCVFAGFFALMLAGLFVQMLNAFGTPESNAAAKAEAEA
ncbi:MAG: type II secretion system F family protein [Deltaproteobacteria bacterium]|nr:type II secretion system F family protein [Deltaproteobacteria bacterium]